jgi:hypothetical protein
MVDTVYRVRIPDSIRLLDGRAVVEQLIRNLITSTKASFPSCSDVRDAQE